MKWSSCGWKKFHAAKQVGAQLSWLGWGTNPSSVSLLHSNSENKSFWKVFEPFFFNPFGSSWGVSTASSQVSYFNIIRYITFIFLSFMYWLINHGRWETSLGKGLTRCSKYRGNWLNRSRKEAVFSRFCLHLLFTNRQCRNCTRSTNVGSGEGQPTRPLQRL